MSCTSLSKFVSMAESPSPAPFGREHHIRVVEPVDDSDSGDEGEFEDARSMCSSPRPPLTREELKAKILAQVHFYFGDINYPQDRFLRSLARENPQHLIPLTTVASFKKIRKYTEDVAIVAEALADSEVVELSADQTMIKRRHPLPHNPEDMVYRTVVVEGAADVAPELVCDWCSKAGRVVRSRIFNPSSDRLPEDIRALLFNGKPSPASQPRSPKMHPAFRPLGPPVHLVEFEDLEDAVKAPERLSIAASEASDWRHTAHLSIMLKKEKKARKKKTKSSGAGGSDRESIDFSREGASSVPLPYQQEAPMRTRQSATPVHFTSHHQQQHPQQQQDPTNKSPPRTDPVPLRHHLLDKVAANRPRANSWDPSRGSRSTGAAGASPKASPLTDRRRIPGGASDLGAQTPPQPPAIVGGPRSDSADWRRPGSRSASPMPMKDIGLVRSPRGPDGGRGFGSIGRGKPQ